MASLSKSLEICRKELGEGLRCLGRTLGGIAVALSTAVFSKAQPALSGHAQRPGDAYEVYSSTFALFSVWSMAFHSGAFSMVFGKLSVGNVVLSTVDSPKVAPPEGSAHQLCSSTEPKSRLNGEIAIRSGLFSFPAILNISTPVPMRCFTEL